MRVVRMAALVFALTSVVIFTTTIRHILRHHNKHPIYVKQQTPIYGKEQNPVENGVWFSVTVLEQGNFSTHRERRLNVARIKELIPSVHVLEGSFGLDQGCCDVLNKLNIKISKQYNTWEKGLGWIHQGKLGHWCSFLRFLFLCSNKSTEYCVWLEDDCNLDKMRMQLIQDHLYTHNNLISILGEGDEINVVSKPNAVKLLQFYKNYEITLPFDLAGRKDRIRDEKHLFDARLFHTASESTIVCKECGILHYEAVNQKIQKCNSGATTHGFTHYL